MTMRARKVTIHRTIEIDIEVDCLVTPGNPGRTYGPPELCYPPEAADVEIGEVRWAGLVVRADDLDSSDIEAIQDDAIEQAGEDEMAAEEYAAEQAAEARRERMREGDW
jgi:hypothetical protein